MTSQTFVIHGHQLLHHRPSHRQAHLGRRRRIVHAVAIVVLVAATVVLLFVASDAGGRNAIRRWSTMRGGSFASDVPHWSD
jgi:hypothetical protein